MALIKCPDCNAQISDRAVLCVNCGRPMNQQNDTNVDNTSCQSIFHNNFSERSKEVKKSYWGYRIDNNRIELFNRELMQGRLRQGWGWLEGQNLRRLTIDNGAKRNLPMFERVKRNDILLVPHLPTFEYVAIVEATEDWDIGYRFDTIKEIGDYGHIFPAKYITHFSRDSAYVTKLLRTKLRIISRFWEIRGCENDIEMLLKVE